jgi:chorismate lyase
MLLFGDGSPTRLLSLLTGAPLGVSVLGMDTLAGSGGGLAEAQLAALWAPLALAPAAIAPPRVLRRVWLEAPRGQRMGYACSWWNAQDVAGFLPDQAAPIGGALAAQRHEIHRELLGVVHAVGHAGLEEGLGLPGRGGSSGSSSAGLGAEAAQVAAPGADWGARALWGRWYVMRQGGAPLCVVYEVFSPALERLLGPRHAVSA